MAAIEVTRLARDELSETRELPLDTGKRVSRSLLTLEEFPRAGKQLSGRLARLSRPRRARRLSAGGRPRSPLA